MNLDHPTINTLFGQLGLPSDNEAIEDFIEKNQGLDEKVRLEDAPFWNHAQSTFLRSALEEDAEWTELIDQLDSRLR